MIEDRSRPGNGGVAGAALEIRGDVPRTFPLSLHVVVAGRATPVRLCVIEVDGRYPRDRGMATVALFRRQDVICRLRGSANTGADAVARRASPWRALENGTRMALLTWQIAVLARQLKAGCEMVELRALLGAESRGRKRKCEQKCQKRGEYTHVVA